MALLDKLKGALGDAVSEGIGKGIQNAVGKAVEGAVRPAADKLAGRAADQLNEASRDLAANTEAVRGARQAGVPAGAQASQGSGTAALGTALSGWTSAMQEMAGQAVQNLKECPNCGEVSTADRKFCPKCGTPLPDKTLGEEYFCPKCGKQNLPGETFCAECGTLLPAAVGVREAQLARWDTLLPQYPRWSQGGVPELTEGDRINDAPAVHLEVAGAGSGELRGYVEQLKAAGFLPVHGEDSDLYYKTVDGVCRAFDKTDAVQGGGLSVTFFVGDFDRAAARDKADAALDTAKDAAKAAKDAAKGLFKKFF